MKKLLMITSALILFMILTVSLPLTVSAADVNTDMDIRVFIDGEEIEFDVKPAVIDQRTMVPMRFIFEYFGLDVEWNQNDQSITARLGDSPYLCMQLNSKIMQIYNDDGITKKWLNVAPCAINGRTLVPLRAIAEIFGADVAWEQETTSVIITTPYPKHLDQSLTTRVLDEYTDNSYTYHNPSDASEYLTVTFDNNRMKVSGMMLEDYEELWFSIEDKNYQIYNINQFEEFSAEFPCDFLDIPDSVELRCEKGGFDIIELGFVNIIQNNGINEFEAIEYTVDYDDVSFKVSVHDTSIHVSGVALKDCEDLNIVIDNYYGYSVGSFKQGESFSKEFNQSFYLNPTDADLQVSGYKRVNGERYHEIFNEIILNITDGNIEIAQPKVLMIYDYNYELVSKWIAPSFFLKDIKEQELIDLSNAICQGTTDDYEKVRRIHDWVCENIYYDNDYYEGRAETTEYDPVDVLQSRKTVCEGYTNLLQALIQAQNIPCRKIHGLALGSFNHSNITWSEVDQAWDQAYSDTNHAWNQAYIDNRWVNIDATWNSNNYYRYGKYHKNYMGDSYYDISLYDFSHTHLFKRIKT